LATFTEDLVVPYLQVEAARKGFAADIYVAPFNSVTQELIKPTSGCIAHQPDIVFVAQHLGDICPPLVHEYLALDHTRIEQYIEDTISELTAALKGFRELSQAVVVVHNFSLPPYPLLGIYEPMVGNSQTRVVRRLNERLVETVKEIAGVYILDYDRLCAEVGLCNWYDDKMWHLARAPLSAQAMVALARRYAAFMRAVAGTPRKCLVLDLDNVLWGGVIGESRIGGIQLGHTYPGNVFHQFQQAVLQLHHRGVILAINSKNNREDVEGVFQTHPDMVLRWEHFASVRINWHGKPENMLEIAQEVNIGLDSLVFFDDDPVERAMMCQALPQVVTLEVPDDPVRYARILLGSGVFDKLSFTDEDRQRGAMYQGQVARRGFEKSAMSLEDFLKSLEMAVTIRPVNGSSFARVLELIHKTNQFNLTTRRHGASQLKEMTKSPGWGVFSLRAADRFGDNGIVGVAILHAQQTTVKLDTFLLSCRVIGRGIETALLSFLVDWAKTREVSAIDAEFVPTAKNAPAADFLSRHGFRQLDVRDGTSLWRLGITDVPFEWPSFIRLIDR
jgi:FkbH-like protein